MSQIPAHTSSSIRRCRPLPRRTRKARIDRRPPLDERQPLDDKAQFFVGWWHRMHRGRSGLICVNTKPVVFPDDKTGDPARYVWEVCKWPCYGGFNWVFVCWMIDRVGMWSKRFSTKKGALAYFREAPAIVMAPPTDSGDRRGVLAPATAAASSPAP